MTTSSTWWANLAANPAKQCSSLFPPQNSYLRFVNNIVTGESKSKLAFSASEPATAPDGSLTVTLTGNIPLGMEPQTAAFAVPSPTKFATAALGDLLKSAGIAVNSKAAVPIGDFTPYQRFYTAEINSPNIFPRRSPKKSKLL